MNRSRLWRTIRRVWITLGLTATAIFTAWSLIAYRSSPVARDAVTSDARVTVSHALGSWSFVPTAGDVPPSAGLLFFAGSLVDPRAYAPLARAVAEAGYPAIIVELPRRGAFGGADDPALLTHARALMLGNESPRAWVVGGHSRGAVVAVQLVAGRPERLAGLVLIGTSHPRDVDLSGLAVPVTKIVGTRDGLASPGEVRANQHKLPSSTRWVWIEGGNHSQFGWYGFQPGDRFARITRDAQHAAMISAVLAALEAVRARGAGG